ncbi:glyoxalase/bleomycin resistance/extradiol dioxygenase family protein [Shewanella sp. FJAT-51649]|uniref:VOC family protein n=1 Tax=Shewanella sp. FJAT-51649 TaxID=2864210 RepID=UPI001C658554|nr:VOC family protein [Shewanella sp. FJAT-51649]QYJ70110.1 glyoxalase/bleomycin resistance/extradiol dioxygenase family protein [Shewanella sp. FJAT-51649]
MAQSIFVNLAVENVQQSRAFYAGLGFGINEQYSNEQAACVVIADNIYVMLLAKPFFAGFTDKPIADARTTTEVLNCLDCDSRERVDQLVKLAEQQGGKTYRQAQDQGFMYGHAFEDPDGHIWELVYMTAQPS